MKANQAENGATKVGAVKAAKLKPEWLKLGQIRLN